MAITETDKHSKSEKAVNQSEDAWRTNLSTFMVLFKSRVVSLLLMAAIGGAFLGAGGWPGLGNLVALILAGGLAASGAAGMNEYLEQGPDAIMGRTKRRPLVTGAAQPRWVLWISLAMIVVPVVIVLPFNLSFAFFLFLGAVIYVGLYTILLKPRTLLNIVIGGAAGSAAVMSGGAAVGNWNEPAVIMLALLVFIWTPSHFWSLAILYKKDYERAGIPMLPVHTSLKGSAYWVMLHTGTAALIALLLVMTPNLGLAYFIPVLVATAGMIVRNIRLIKAPTPASARSLFIASNIYLAVVLLSICAGTLLHNLWSVL